MQDAAAETSTDKIYAVYGHQTSVTNIINRLKRDKNNWSLNPNLRVSLAGCVLWYWYEKKYSRLCFTTVAAITRHSTSLHDALTVFVLAPES